MTAQVGFTDTTSGEQMVQGQHQVGVKFNLTSTSLTQLNNEFTGYVLLPKGVSYDAGSTAASANYSVELVKADFNQTGEA
ncbi:hypothetical protein [Secundilactobacillus oryzae]|uniref:hypothetical protein n=1 Tax=Secundilactobacillus oryzae TaxID=1202668 RepID=UPI0005520987|nr:hypothetical protein [Secundilactobacillus oryzae]